MSPSLCDCFSYSVSSYKYYSPGFLPPRGPRKDMIMLSGKDDKVGAMNIFVVVKRDAWILLIHRYSESFIVIPCGVKLCDIYLMGINHVLSQ